MAYNFDTIASNYDQMNHLMTASLDRLWRRRTVRHLLSRYPNASVLDVACGTGDLSIVLYRRHCQVVGVDISQQMLAIAQNKTKQTTIEGVIPPQFSIANAEALPFENESFDAVTVAFGVRNFLHLSQGLSEMHRVLKTGGALFLLELSTPDSPLIRPFYNFYSHKIIPLLGHLISHNRQAYTYLPNSIEVFPKNGAMIALLNSVGFSSVKQYKYTFGVCRLYIAIKQEECRS